MTSSLSQEHTVSIPQQPPRVVIIGFKGEVTIQIGGIVIHNVTVRKNRSDKAPSIALPCIFSGGSPTQIIEVSKELNEEIVAAVLAWGACNER